MQHLTHCLYTGGNSSRQPDKSRPRPPGPASRRKQQPGSAALLARPPGLSPLRRPQRGAAARLREPPPLQLPEPTPPRVTPGRSATHRTPI